MTHTQRTAKAHSNLFTAFFIALAFYLIWPVLSGGHDDAPQQTREETR